jgi:probable F420-dependent oxidoreductase
MKVGLSGLGFGDWARPEIVSELAKGMDDLGFARLWGGEHVILPTTWESPYPYARGGDFYVDSTTPALNPLVAIAYCASITTRLRFATGVLLVPEYNPVLLAKLVATVDFLSNGRFALGIGIGWLREEFEALQVPDAPLPWEGRAKRTREYVEAMRTLWQQPVSSYKSESVAFDEVLCYPKPVNGTVPIIYGGHSDIALRRAARYCDGICLFNLTPDETTERIKALHAMLEEFGRPTEGFDITIGGLFDMTPDMIPDYAATGADELMLQTQQVAAAGGGAIFRTDENVRPEAIRPALEQLAEEWVRPAAAVGIHVN